MAMHSAVRAAIAGGLLLAALFGVKQVDLEKVMGLLPREAPMWAEASGVCPCKAAKEKCTDAGKKTFGGDCKMLWQKCSILRQKKTVGWEACTLAKKKCKDNNREGWCSALWQKCDEELKAHSAGKVDTKDCYFDKKCHKLVDWKQIEKLKMGILARMKAAVGDDAKMKDLLARAHELFKKAGMPEDRIDYMLWKWTKYAAKEEATHAKIVDTKDCYFDAECHKLVDWKKIGDLKQGILARMKFMQGDEAKMKGLMEHAHSLFKDAGMPEDRIDYILEKWAKYVAGEPASHSHGSGAACKGARANCLQNGKRVFDGQCRALWGKCRDRKQKEEDMKEHVGELSKTENMKEGILKRMTMLGDDKEKMKNLMEIAHQKLKEAGMPEDRINYTLEKLAEVAANESKVPLSNGVTSWSACKVAKDHCLEGQREKISVGRCGILWKKCNEQSRTHKLDVEQDSKVDWTLISKLKEGLLPRMKKAKAGGDDEQMINLMMRARVAFKEAGLPESKVEFILERWTKSVEHESKKMEKDEWKFCVLAKTKCWEDGQKVLDSECSSYWKKCEAEAEAHSYDKKKVDTKDCYFDKDCHKRVDWKQIQAAKDGIIGRMKMMQGDEAKMKAVVERAHELFQEAGMPDDRIDYILEKWAKGVAGKH